MAKSYAELQELKKKAERLGITMAELGRRGGLKAARLKKEREQAKSKPTQMEFKLESFKQFVKNRLK